MLPSQCQRQKVHPYVPRSFMAEPSPLSATLDSTLVPTHCERRSIPQDLESSRSSRVTASTASHVLRSAREPRDPRGCPLSGASRDHENVHRQFHDNAAGARDSWWLRQRDISTNYARSNGTLVGGPPVLSLPNENLNARSRHIAKQLREAFAGAAGHRTCVVGALAPIPSQIQVQNAPSKEEPSGARPSPDQRWRKQSRQVAIRVEQDFDSGGLKNRREHPAGKRIMGIVPRTEGLKVYPAAADVCEADGLIPGRETSPRRVETHFGAGLGLAWCCCTHALL